MHVTHWSIYTLVWMFNADYKRLPVALLLSLQTFITLALVTKEGMEFQLYTLSQADTSFCSVCKIHVPADVHIIKQKESWSFENSGYKTEHLLQSYPRSWKSQKWIGLTSAYGWKIQPLTLWGLQQITTYIMVHPDWTGHLKNEK